MLIKLNPIAHAFVRHKVEVQPKELTKQQRITYDRIIITILFISVIIAAVILS